MTLPVAGAAYDAGNERSARAAIERELARRIVKGQDIELASGERLILRSPNGSRWSLGVTDAGDPDFTAL
jgi:hypothetical protein